MSTALRDDPFPPTDRPAARHRAQPSPFDDRYVPPPPRRRRTGALIALGLVGLVLLPVLAGGAAAFAVARLGEPVYAARSEVLFDLRTLDWGTTDRFLATQTVLARSPATLAPVAAELGVPLAELDAALRAEMVGQSTVLQIEYRDRSRARALAVVTALTDRYLATLRELGAAGGTRHRLLTPAYALERPVEPRPERAGALGAAVGLALGIAMLLLAARPRAP